MREFLEFHRINQHPVATFVTIIPKKVQTERISEFFSLFFSRRKWKYNLQKKISDLHAPNGEI